MYTVNQLILLPFEYAYSVRLSCDLTMKFFEPHACIADRWPEVGFFYLEIESCVHLELCHVTMDTRAALVSMM